MFLGLSVSSASIPPMAMLWQGHRYFHLSPIGRTGLCLLPLNVVGCGFFDKYSNEGRETMWLLKINHKIMALQSDWLETFLGRSHLSGKKSSYPKDTMKRRHGGEHLLRHSLWALPGDAPDMCLQPQPLESTQLRSQSKDNALCELLTLTKCKITRWLLPYPTKLEGEGAPFHRKR